MSILAATQKERCHFCPRQNELQEHHIVPDRFEGRDTRENIVCVCERCHKKLERLYDKRFYERLGIADETGERYQHFECEMADCSDRADAKMYGSIAGGWAAWYCIRCATEQTLRQQHTKVVKDPTGRLTTRKRWIDHVNNRNSGGTGAVA